MMDFNRIVDRRQSYRLLFAAALIIVLAILFWTGSRYPSLDEKAMMGGMIHLEDPLSFEAIFPISPDMSVLERIFYSTLNWIDTNKKGMTFGLLMGASFLTLLGYMRQRSFSGPFANSLYGMFLGAPLGVCVNCAAPIAKGLYQGGSRAETTLSAMIASPTLNIVVMTMAFSLLPFYIAATKLALSLMVILLVVPIVCRFIPEEKLLRTVGNPDAGPPAPEAVEEVDPQETLTGAALGFARDFGRNLFFILKMTLPLMLLAGILGAVAATLVPTEWIVDREFNLVGASIAAVVGTFLPVPIGFDVVLSGAMLNGGAGHGFAMTLVFTLGTFSIYSFFIIGGSVGWRAASMVGGAVIALGLLAGLGVDAWHKMEMRSALELLLEDEAAETTPVEPAGNTPQPSVASALAAPAILAADIETELTIERIEFAPTSAIAETLFTRQEAWHHGIDHPVEFSLADMWPPFWEGRSVASGDIDRDGDLDLVFASTRQGLYVYLNNGQGQFSAATLALGSMADLPIFNAALVDLDNDGWQDLFLTSYREGLFVVPNIGGQFDFAAATSVANREDAILALSASFGDVDRDGDLDVALGNWAAGWYRRVPGEESRNRILFNDGAGYGSGQFADLPGIPGETLSILLSDIDSNGTLDLMVGNDFEVPDYFYLGDGRGSFDAITFQDGRIPMTTTTTMSLSSADLDNDGSMDLYMAQIAGRASGISDRLHMQRIEDYCLDIEREEDRAVCQQNMDIKSWYRPGNSLDPSYASRCGGMDEPYRSECRGMLVKDLAIQNNDASMCALIPVGQDRARQYCDIHFAPIRAMTAEETDAAIPQILDRNVLLEMAESGAFEETGEARGVEVGGWSWDVSVGDFDNDGWQDIYIVNGTWVPNEVTPSNIFLRNRGDGTFEEVTEAAGLVDYHMTAAATLFDADNDGDLDIVAVPVNAPPVMFTNNSQSAQAIAFMLVDQIGNRDGIGARIEIETDAGPQSREIQLGGGFMSFDAPIAHFGLGVETDVRAVSIRWADGSVEEINQPFEAGGLYQITRASSEAETDGE